MTWLNVQNARLGKERRGAHLPGGIQSAGTQGCGGPPREKDETHPYENERECQRTLGGVRERESWIGNYMIVMRDLWFKR